VIAGSPPASVRAGSAFAFTPTASDADGDTLTFSISGAPAWASFNAQTGRLSGTPAGSHVGTYPNIVITVSDGKATASLASFSVSVGAAVGSGTGRATMTWAAPLANTDGSTLTNLSGFRIYYGNSEDVLDNTIDVSNPSISTYTIENLPSGVWYFGVRAYTSNGAESDLSNIGSKTIS
jgi:hypothetical protein